LTVVVDASIALGWFFDDERSGASIGVLTRLAVHGTVVPGHWHLEIANGLLVALRRQRTTTERIEGFLSLLERLDVDVDSHTPLRACHATFAIAADHQLTIYDAAYLELSLRRSLPLATANRPLRAAAQRTGVDVL